MINCKRQQDSLHAVSIADTQQKEPRVAARGSNVFQRRSFYGLTITTVLCLFITLVEPLANAVQDEPCRHVRCDSHQERREHCFHLLSKDEKVNTQQRIYFSEKISDVQGDKLSRVIDKKCSRSIEWEFFL